MRIPAAISVIWSRQVLYLNLASAIFTQTSIPGPVLPCLGLPRDRSFQAFVAHTERVSAVAENYLEHAISRGPMHD